MRIAYLVNTYPRASHSFIRREIQALERLGWDIHRFAMRSDRGNLVDAADLAEDDRTEHLLMEGFLRLIPDALGWMLRHPIASLKALAQALHCGGRGRGGAPGTGGRLRHLAYLIEAAYVARRCDMLKIGHVHAHFGTNATTVAMLAATLRGPGYSFTVHGPEEFDAPRALSIAAKARAARFGVAISSFGRSQLCRWTALQHWPRLQVVHCGIDPAHFGEPLPLPAGGPHLVAIGRLAEQKGFPLLIEAIAMAAPVLPGLHLTLVGAGELRGVIENAIRLKGLGRQVTLTGWLDEAGVRHALTKAQALVLPSFAEGLPVVLMEAMAAGRPVIASAVAGVPELVTPETGWLVPAGDPAALAQAIIDLAATPAARLAAMGNTARNRVLARHDVNREAQKLSALFAELRPDAEG